MISDNTIPWVMLSNILVIFMDTRGYLCNMHLLCPKQDLLVLELKSS